MVGSNVCHITFVVGLVEYDVRPSDSLFSVQRHCRMRQSIHWSLVIAPHISKKSSPEHIDV